MWYDLCSSLCKTTIDPTGNFVTTMRHNVVNKLQTLYKWSNVATFRVPTFSSVWLGHRKCSKLTSISVTVLNFVASRYGAVVTALRGG